jgi:hypothetical protein
MLKRITWLSLSLLFCLTVLLTIINSPSVVLQYNFDSLAMNIALGLVLTVALGRGLRMVLTGSWLGYLCPFQRLWQQHYRQAQRDIQVLVAHSTQDSVSQ